VPGPFVQAEDLVATRGRQTERCEGYDLKQVRDFAREQSSSSRNGKGSHELLLVGCYRQYRFDTRITFL